MALPRLREMAQYQTATPAEMIRLFSGDVATCQGKKGYWRIEMVPEDALTAVEPPVPIESIRKATGVADRIYAQFLASGIPPVGTVIATALLTRIVWLVSRPDLTLIVREVRPGDQVKLAGRESMVGIVQDSTGVCSLQGPGRARIRSVTSSDEARDWLVSNWSFLSGDQKSMLQYNIRQNTIKIPYRHLKLDTDFCLEGLVLYRGWIGRIETIEYDVSVHLFSGRQIVVQRHDQLERMGEELIDDVFFAKGDLVQLSQKKGVRAFCSDYRPGYDPLEDRPETCTGVVDGVRTRLLKVEWIHCGLDRFQDKPPESLDHLAMHSDEFAAFSYRAYEGVGRDVGPFADFSPAPPTITSRVRVPDASIRSLFGLDSDPSSNYILTDIEQTAKVEWQDGSNSAHNTSALHIVAGADEPVNIYPGSLVCTHDTLPGHEGTTADNFIRPERVGVVQTLDVPNMLALVRWCHEPTLALVEGDHSSEESRLRVHGDVVGSLSAAHEEVSLYDCYAPDCLNPILGDVIFMRSERGLHETNESIKDHLGCVLRINLDATYEVRLGLASVVRDVQVSVNDMICIIPRPEEADPESNDGTDPEHVEPFSSRTDRPVETTIEYDDGTFKDIEMTDDNDWDTQSDAETVASMTPCQAFGLSDPGVVSSKPPQIVTESAESDVVAQTLITPNAASQPLPYLLHSDESIHHHYARDAFAVSRPRTKAIQREHKILSAPASVPEGVFVRSWESRMDLFRVLIVGPAGTPYTSAPFVFDIALPSQYPQEPPLVFFEHWTTGVIRLSDRCNPNLYVDGKCCLSLLGTWDGDSNRSETWVPGQSTVLQVLVSILGLVLVAEPFYSMPTFSSLLSADHRR